MRYIILTLTLLFTLSSNGQIGASEKAVKWETIGVAKKMVGYPILKKKPDSDYYVLSYDNLEYPNIDDVKDVGFTATASELEYLYNELLKGFNSKDRINITVGEHNLSYKKVASSIRIDVTKPYETDGWFYLSKKQLAKLFGK